MPKTYNVPEWYDAEYQEKADIVSSATIEAFSDLPYPWDAVEELSKSSYFEDKDLLHRFLIHAPPSSLEGLSYESISNRDPIVFLNLLPAFILASINLQDRGKSPAE